jgi:hypothetical protein
LQECHLPISENEKSIYLIKSLSQADSVGLLKAEKIKIFFIVIKKPLNLLPLLNHLKKYQS